MVEREKVIKGLEHCVIYADSPGFQACDECPYNDDGDIGTCESNWKLLKDALELLKEQEPHVLAYDDAINAEYCVLETIDHGLYQFVHERTLAGGNVYFSPDLNGANHPYFEVLAEKDEYNKHVRCWNRLPTKEQRKAVKWDD